MKNKLLLPIIFLAMLILPVKVFAQAQSASGQFTLTVNAASTLSITTTSLVNVVVNASYPSTTLTATGGVVPYTWGVSSGSLPAGLTLTAAGVLYGTPTAVGSTMFTVQVKDSESNPVTATQQYTINVASQLVVSPNLLPAATAGVSYSQTVAVTGGTAPYTCSLSSGTLPSGLTLTSTATGCLVSGTPTAAGNFPITLKVVDSGH